MFCLINFEPFSNTLFPHNLYPNVLFNWLKGIKSTKTKTTNGEEQFYTTKDVENTRSDVFAQRFLPSTAPRLEKCKECQRTITKGFTATSQRASFHRPCEDVKVDQLFGS